MSLDSGSTASIGAIATPLATILNPALGLAVGAGFSLFTASASADEQRELTERNIKIQMDLQRANELRTRRTNAQAVGRVRTAMATSGFTSRGTPIEKLASFVGDQELDIQMDRFRAKLGIEDLRIRGDFLANQTLAQGVAAASVGLGKSGLTLLGRRDDFDLLE